MNKDIELQVWKDLATNKQVLMTAVIEALNLDPDCSSGDLRLAINLLKERADDAEKHSTHLESGQEHLNRVIEEKDDEIATAVCEMERAIGNLDFNRQVCATEVSNARELVKQKTKELKAINKLLSDSPENVVKKLKKLKQKNVEQAKYTKDIENKFKDAVRMCERLRDEIEERVAEKKKLQGEIDKMTNVKTETNE